jgi:mRNA interferase MazF
MGSLLMTTRHKVFLVPFPFDDLSSAKVRPAICLTEPIGPHRHVILALITSQPVLTPLLTDLLLDAHHADFSATGLRVTSTARLHRLITVSTSMLSRELGVLSPVLQVQVTARLKHLFQL